MKVILFQMEAVRKYKNTTFVFYRMLMEDEECRQIQKAYDEAISAVLDQNSGQVGFSKKNIPGSGSSIALEEPSCTS